MDVLLTEMSETTLFLSLNRPDKRNALNDELISALKEAIADAGSNGEVRAVVIRGEGKDFCSGADLTALQKIAESDIVENLEDAESLMDLFIALRRIEKPVIAAVHGRALAGGCGLATACDIVLAAENARFGYPEVKIGFVPAMVMAILRRNLGEKLSFELITRGFEFSAEDAFDMGLINKVLDEDGFQEAVAEYAAGYAEVSSSAVALSKRLLYSIDGSDFESALRSGAEINAIARMTKDCQDGIAKFLDRK
ncbi:MAG: enoyl-CoA hydratase/isomerase family protein [Acidobacteria bacterium]|nr:MAG: enoyl-CoA hydratase/isomerase family protein [Acidobacteriota bacterium]REK01771.1 MAG: enoyl-CoA hydratase/isomerase family protein [Acidobacteriota bacterium]REK14727.1 MAG: enoyl-CoA hydratase/isomerase family protein [Acidobacteriota bacterium]REK45442.1 MAG: enoyl-CoA hydratase/isomerase family protein [Acidobacteriota bacterium]